MIYDLGLFLIFSRNSQLITTMNDPQHMASSDFIEIILMILIILNKFIHSLTKNVSITIKIPLRVVIFFSTCHEFKNSLMPGQIWVIIFYLIINGISKVLNNYLNHTFFTISRQSYSYIHIHIKQKKH